MDFEIKERTKITAKIYGQEFPVTKPLVGQVEALQDELKKDGANPVKIMSEFGQKLGLPKDVIDKMEADHFMALMDFLTGQKKK